jgi:hypothetical protein
MTFTESPKSRPYIDWTTDGIVKCATNKRTEIPLFRVTTNGKTEVRDFIIIIIIITIIIIISPRQKRRNEAEIMDEITQVKISNGIIMRKRKCGPWRNLIF